MTKDRWQDHRAKKLRCSDAPDIEDDNDDDDEIDRGEELLKNNIILVNGGITPKSSTDIIENLLTISCRNDDDIIMYLRCEGGLVDNGLSIIGVMNMIKNDVKTVCIGDCSSMGAFILSAGKKGKRYALPFSRIMIHQLSAGIEGKLTEMRDQLQEHDISNEVLMKEFAKNTGKKIAYVRNICKNDYYMSAQEALEFGIIDKIVRHQSEIK